MSVEKHLELLGHEVKDKVSDFKGVVTSVSFDLYGCIQAVVRSIALGKEGEITNGIWLDVSRLIVLSKEPLMESPNFEHVNIPDGGKGPENLPPKLDQTIHTNKE